MQTDRPLGYLRQRQQAQTDRADLRGDLRVWCKHRAVPGVFRVYLSATVWVSDRFLYQRGYSCANGLG